MAGAAFRRLKAAIFRPSEPGRGSTLDLRDEFAVFRTVEHGFPHRPSTISFSPELRVLAIGCQSGEIFIYGKSGVEVTAKHDPESSIVQVLFLGRQMRILTVGFENDLHLWRFENKDDRCKLVEEAYHQVVYPATKRVSVACYPDNSNQVAVGTEGGNVLLISLDKLSFSGKQDDIIFWNKATEPTQGTNKLHPGSVEALESCPTDSDKLLIGYDKGSICMWSLSLKAPVRNFPPIQYLCSASWHPDGRMFASAHEDGSLAMWSVEDDTEHGGSSKPYGVQAECRKVQQVMWRGNESNGMLIFEGGLDRGEYGDRFCVSIQQGKDLVAFEFTSRVIGFTVVDDVDDEPDALIVLCEEELVTIDLKTPGMPTMPKPYLYSLHDSPLTCIQHVSNCPHDFWLALHGVRYQTNEKSTRPWPIDGGLLHPQRQDEASSERSLLVTGHEDGSIRFWDATGVSLSLVYKVGTGQYFMNIDAAPEEEEASQPEAEKWPVFVKAGTFDPFCDDPRLAIMQVEVCPLSRTMAVAGFGGQVMVFDFNPESTIATINRMIVEMKLEGEDISRKLNEMLEFEPNSLELAAGFQASVGLLTCPPSPILTLSLSSQFGLLGLGCRRGLAIVDYFQTQTLAVECTILEEESRRTLSRLQSMRKSFRLTMVRIRNQSVGIMPRRARRNYDTPMAALTGPAPPPRREREKRETLEEIQQRRDQLGNAVRCVQFANTFGPGINTVSPTAFCCTNSGRTFLYSLELPADVNRHKEAVNVRPIDREFALRHGAPILAFTVVDHSGKHIATSFEINMNRGKSADNRIPHFAVFCTEEQVKVVTLPNLKYHAKFKLFETDESQLQRVGFMRLEDGHMAVGIVNNDGEAIILSLPDLSVRLRTQGVRWDDFRGQRTFIFTRNFEGFHMRSPSQLQRLALMPKRKIAPKCSMLLREERVRVARQQSSGATSGDESTAGAAAEGMKDKPRSLSNALTSAFGGLFHRNRTPTPTDSARRESASTPTKPQSPIKSPRSPPTDKATDKQSQETEPDTVDFFESELSRTEKEGDFVSEVLSGMDSFQSPQQELSPVGPAKPIPKPRATSTPQKTMTAQERMLKAAEERNDRLKNTEVHTQKMANSAAGLAAISGLLAAKGHETEPPSHTKEHKSAERVDSIPNDPKSHEDMESLLDRRLDRRPEPKAREVNIDEAAKSTRPAGGRSKSAKQARTTKSPSTSSTDAAAGKQRRWFSFK